MSWELLESFFPVFFPIFLFFPIFSLFSRRCTWFLVLQAQLELQQGELELSHSHLQHAQFLLQPPTGEHWEWGKSQLSLFGNGGDPSLGIGEIPVWEWAISQ